MTRDDDRLDTNVLLRLRLLLLLLLLLLLNDIAAQSRKGQLAVEASGGQVMRAMRGLPAVQLL